MSNQKNKDIRDKFSSSPAFAELLVQKEKHWTDFEEKEEEEDLLDVSAPKNPHLYGLSGQEFGKWEVILDGVDYSNLISCVQINTNTSETFSMQRQIEVVIDFNLPIELVRHHPDLASPLRDLKRLYESARSVECSVTAFDTTQQLKAQFICHSYTDSADPDLYNLQTQIILRSVSEPIVNHVPEVVRINPNTHVISNDEWDTLDLGKSKEF